MRTEKNISVFPMQSYLMALFGGDEHRGGPNWSDWSDVNTSRFFRNNNPVDSIPETQCDITEKFQESGVWIGPLSWHFGHFVSEVASRLPYSMNFSPSAPIIFAADLTVRSQKEYRKSFSPQTHPPLYLSQIIEWFGGDPKNIITIGNATRFEELYSFPQAEHLGNIDACGPSSFHIDVLTENSRRMKIENRDKAVFVSRSHVKKTIAGEEYLEKAFSDAGVDVIFPEKMTIEAQMCAYMSYETIIFPEGSALHGLQLLGKIPGRVILIQRRQTHPFRKYIDPRAAGFTEVNAIIAQVFGRWPVGRHDTANGISILDPDKFVADMKNAGIDLEKVWSSRQMMKAARADFFTWLRDTGISIGSVSVASATCLTRTAFKGALKLAMDKVTR